MRKVDYLAAVIRVVSRFILDAFQRGSISEQMETNRDGFSPSATTFLSLLLGACSTQGIFKRANNSTEDIERHIRIRANARQLETNTADLVLSGNFYSAVAPGNFVAGHLRQKCTLIPRKPFTWMPAARRTAGAYDEIKKAERKEVEKKIGEVSEKQEPSGNKNHRPKSNVLAAFFQTTSVTSTPSHFLPMSSTLPVYIKKRIASGKRK